MEELASCVAENVRTDKPDAIVFQLLDNILYQGRCLDGSTSLQSKDGDGRFHVEGELILAPKTSQLNIFNMLKPVMAAGGEVPFIFITPMPCYMSGTSCDSEEHLTNRSGPGIVNNLLDGLEDVRRNFRSFLFNDNIRRAGVINPCPLIEGMEEEEVWETDDPIHPKTVFYTKLAKLTIEQVERVIGKRRRSEDDDYSSRTGREWSNFTADREGGSGGGGSWRGGGGRGRGGSWRVNRGSRPYGGGRSGQARYGGWSGSNRRSSGSF